MGHFRFWFFTAMLMASTVGHAIDLSQARHHYPSSDFIVEPRTEPYDLSGNTMKVVGSRDFEKVRDFPRDSKIYQLSKKIGIMLTLYPDSIGFCSGSLVGPDLLLTNEHCAFNNGKQVPLDQFFFSFSYYHDPLESVTKSPIYRAAELLKYNKRLDYALYRLRAPIGKELGWFAIESNDNLLRSSSHVKIIQHPAGRSKEVARRNAQIYKIHADKQIVHYLADTEGGSSGSPVFSADGNSIIALHHAGYTDNSGRGVVNEGILASAIYAEIHHYLPKPPARKPATPVASQSPPPPEPARTRQPAPAPTVRAPAPAPDTSRATDSSRNRPVSTTRTTPAAAPKPRDCGGAGMMVEREDGSFECMAW